ncbi:hypothetical protein HMPREF9012_1568 [Bacteroidetes bacterium oral taxon 272 str. F0290]|nr:hypothetical protein HMPREF9012_1568 [Bacteroidetes bacterium oral taxon 272 str. F0290]
MTFFNLFILSKIESLYIWLLKEIYFDAHHRMCRSQFYHTF